MKDAIVFALVLLAAMCSEDIPLLLGLVLLAGAMGLGGKMPNVWGSGQKKTAPRGANSESGKADKKSSEKLSIRRDYTTV